jgi:hypothetical protein
MRLSAFIRQVSRPPGARPGHPPRRRDFIATCIGRAKPQLEQHIAGHFHFTEHPSPRSQPSAMAARLARVCPRRRVPKEIAIIG